jgi:hypothetical protein
VDPAVFEELRVNHAWVLGGPMTPPFRARVREHTGTLHTLATTLAVRAMWGGEEFWTRYRGRFMNARIAGGDRWAAYFSAPDHIIRLLFTPAQR